MERPDGRGVAITGGASDGGAAIGAELRSLGATLTLIDGKTPRVARARAFLCSDCADNMTGSALLVASGYSLGQFAEDVGS